MTIERSGIEALNPTISITPDLPIGTELWFMNANKPSLALVVEYIVYVTSYKDDGKLGWYEQIFYRWLNRKQKEYWRYSWQYTIKIDGDIFAHRLEKKGDKYYIYDKKCFFSKEDLLKSL